MRFTHWCPFNLRFNYWIAFTYLLLWQKYERLL